MDDRRFDDLSRSVGASTSRRAALAALAAAATAGAGTADARRRRRCRPACPPGQTCIDRVCTCDGGETVCGAACCAAGQECRDGACVAPPPACVEFGQACKNVGVPCCEPLVCGSGRGGEVDVACYVPAGGPCAATAECVFGSTCIAETCVADPLPTPAPACASTFPATASADANGAALRAALQAADPAGPVEIVLAAGEYAMPNWGWANAASPLTIRACPGATVILRPNAAYETGPFFESRHAVVVLAGLTFVGPGPETPSIGVVHRRNSSGLLTLTGCTVRGFGLGVNLDKNTVTAINGGDFASNGCSLREFDVTYSTLTCTGSPRAAGCDVETLGDCGCTGACN